MMIVALLLVASQLQLIACECFGGEFVSFEAGGKPYVAGWNAFWTKADAAAQCAAVGGKLADINTDEKLADIGGVLGQLDTSGALYSDGNAKFWIDGRTSVAENDRLVGDQLADEPDAPRCQSMGNFQRDQHPDDPFRVYSKPCDQTKAALCETCECFGGEFVSFEADGKYYLAGWNGRWTKADSEAQCAAVGGILADLCTEEKVAAVGGVLAQLDTSGALQSDGTSKFWIYRRTSVPENDRLVGDELAGEPDAPRCISMGNFERDQHPDDPFRVYSKPCDQKKAALCESSAPFCCGFTCL